MQGIDLSFLDASSGNTAFEQKSTFPLAPVDKVINAIHPRKDC